MSGTQQGMKRLTRTDWETINAALAYYEAAPLADEFGLSDEDASSTSEAIARARRKVWERLP